MKEQWGKTLEEPLTYEGKLIEANNRILIIDDNPAIHEDFAKIFGGSLEQESFAAFDKMLFEAETTAKLGIELSAAYQGKDGLDAIVAARAALAPFAIAFVDVRMPPGWDGVETTVRILEADPEIQIVLCSAYSDHSWEDIRRHIGDTDRVLFLRKPFDAIEVQQLAAALQRKWFLASQYAQQMKSLESLVDERTAELKAANEKLRVDLVERLRDEKELRHTQRLEALGRLTAGVGHEINNPLSYVMTNVGFALEVIREVSKVGTVTPAQVEDLVDLLSICESGGERIRTIVTAIGSFSKGERTQLVPVRVDDVVASAASLVRNQIGCDADLAFELQAAYLVQADAGRLEQVIVNLLLNAHQAVQEREHRSICVRTSVVSDSQVAIEVSDTGIGIPEEDLERVFDPFFTTRKIGDGTGLGLALCHELVSQLSGSITLQSTVGVGTTVRIVLPLVDGQSEASTATAGEHVAVLSTVAAHRSLKRRTAHAEESAQPRPRILIVDDDGPVRVALGRLLSEYTVFLADSVAAAVDIYAHNEIDLVLSDVMMPGGGGDLLYAHLESLGSDHGERMLFMTGGVFDVSMQGFLDRVSRPQVAKPLQPAELKKLIRDQLDLVRPCAT